MVENPGLRERITNISRRRQIEEYARSLLESDAEQQAAAARAAALEQRRKDIDAHLSVISILTPAERTFTAAVLAGATLTDAYKLANPNYDGKRAGQLGWKWRRKTAVQSSIDDWFHEQEMGTRELIARMSQQARNEAAAYFRPDGTVDFAAIVRDGKQHLVKGTRFDKDGRLIIEFIPAFDSQVQIGRFLSLWTDKTDVTVDVTQITRIRDERPD